MGLGPDQILALFASPCYRGPHSVYQARGEEYVRDLIAEMTGQRPCQSGLPADLVTIQAAEVKE